MVGTDGQPPGPHPHVHILPCPYDTRPWRADSSYSRGEGGREWMGGPLWSPVVALACPGHCNGIPSTGGHKGPNPAQLLSRPYARPVPWPFSLFASH